MKDSTVAPSSPLPFDLPELSLQVVSFLEIAFYGLVATVVYYLSRRLLQLVGSTGALEKKTLFYQLIHLSSFILPGFIFLYGLTSVSQESLFVSLLFFVIFSIVLGFSMAEPAKSLFASLLIHVRGDIKTGDTITLGNIEGEVRGIGAFNLIVENKSGGRIFIPNHQVLLQAYEIHAKKGGPSIVLNIPADKISKKDLESLAHLCPFKRKGSDVRVSTLENKHKLSIEIVNRESRPWVYRYFENHFQK